MADVTPIRPVVTIRPAASEHKDVRRGSLPAGITIQAEIWLHRGLTYVTLTYRGTRDALIASGCLTSSMIASNAQTKMDEHGGRFSLHRSPTKAQPQRMKLDRHPDSPETAMQLPGVRELFPEGIAEPVQSPSEAPPHLRGPIIQAHADTNGIPPSRPSFLRLVVNNATAPAVRA
jgi:hypothetical protein